MSEKVGKWMLLWRVLILLYGTNDRNVSAKKKQARAARDAGPSPAGDQWCPAPQLKSVLPHFTFGPRLLHTSNTVFWKCCPLFWFLAPLLLNPGDRPAVMGTTKPQKPNARSLVQHYFGAWRCWHVAHAMTTPDKPPLPFCLSCHHRASGPESR